MAGDLLLVLEEAQRRGFLGPGPVTDHIVHAQVYFLAVPVEPMRLLDLGSGGGTPGLVLAQSWTSTEILLLDAQRRRAAFLEEAVTTLGLGDRVAVRHDRAEDAGRDPTLRGTFDLVVARSFGPPAVTAECGAPFLVVGGRLVVSEPPMPDPDRWPPGPLAELALVDAGLASIPGARVRCLVASGPCPARYPRRPGVPGKRPMFG